MPASGEGHTGRRMKLEALDCSLGPLASVDVLHLPQVQQRGRETVGGA